MKQQSNKDKSSERIMNKILLAPMIHDYVPVVRFIAHRLIKCLPSHVDVVDLIGAGVKELMDAISKFDAMRDNNFKTYVHFKIIGAMMDELRAMEWVPRSVHQWSRKFDKTRHEIYQRLGREPTENEIAAGMHMSVRRFREMIIRLRTSFFPKFDDVSDQAERLDLLPEHLRLSGVNNNPLGSLYKKYEGCMLVQAINLLPERDRVVLQLRH